MSAVTYLTEAKDWARALDKGSDLETLRAIVAGWAPFVPDAALVVDAMDAAAFRVWRDGLALERKGTFAGEEHAVRFGNLVIPTALLNGQLLADQYKVPLGALLLRIQQLGRLDELTQVAA